MSKIRYAIGSIQGVVQVPVSDDRVERGNEAGIMEVEAMVVYFYPLSANPNTYYIRDIDRFPFEVQPYINRNGHWVRPKRHHVTMNFALSNLINEGRIAVAKSMMARNARNGAVFPTTMTTRLSSLKASATQDL